MQGVQHTCARCGKTAWSAATSAPMEWATLHYERLHAGEEDGAPATLQTTSTTHVCGDCAAGVLAFIEGTDADSRIGAPQTMAIIAEAMTGLANTNAKMFENTLRVLSEHNARLQAQVAELFTANAQLTKRLETTRPSTSSESP